MHSAHSTFDGWLGSPLGEAVPFETLIVAAVAHPVPYRGLETYAKACEASCSYQAVGGQGVTDSAGIMPYISPVICTRTAHSSFSHSGGASINGLR